MLHGPARCSLLLEELRISKELDVSLRMSGLGTVTRNVIGVSLVAQGVMTPISSTVTCQGTTLWVAAVLPTEFFAGDGAVAELEVRGFNQRVPLRIPRRSVIRHAWAVRKLESAGWPVRVRVNRRNRLVVSGRAPRENPTPYLILADSARLTVSWRDPSLSVSLMRFVHHGTGETAIKEGKPSIAALHEVEVDLDSLEDRHYDWDIQVKGKYFWETLTPAATEHSLHDLTPLPERLLEPYTDHTLRVKVYYTAENTLAIRVRPTRRREL